MPVRIYMLTEINCYETEPVEWAWLRRMMGVSHTRPAERRSLWLHYHPFDPAEDDYTEKGVKVLGPTLPETVAGLVGRLRTLFQSAGIDVVEETVIDD